MALATAQPERRVKPALDKLNLSNYFDAIVTAEDNGSPEVRAVSGPEQHTTVYYQKPVYVMEVTHAACPAFDHTVCVAE